MEKVAIEFCRLCDRVLPDADWAEQLLYSNYKTYEFTSVAQLA